MQRQAGASGLSLLLLFALLPTVALKRNVPHTEVKNSSTSLVDYAVVVEVGRSAEASAMAHVFEYTMPVARAVFPEVLRIPHRRISVGTTAPAVVQTNATRVWPISLVDLLTDAVPFEKRSKSIFEIASRRSDRGSDDLRNLQSLAEARGFKPNFTSLGLRDEAALRWLAANYHAGRLGNNDETLGAVLVGRKSAQVASMSHTAGGELYDMGIRQIGGKTPNLRTYVYNTLGQDSAIEQHVARTQGHSLDPCLRRGSFTLGGAVGTGNHELCRAAVLAASPGLAELGMTMNLHGDGLPGGISIFTDAESTFERLGAVSDQKEGSDMLTVGGIERRVAGACAQKRELGKKARASLIGQGAVEEVDVWECFRATHAALFLSASFHPETTVHWPNQAARSEVDWPLGMVLRSVVTSRQNVGGGHRGGKRSRKDNRLSEGGLRVMAMSLFCAIIFVTTFSMQAPPQVFHRDYESMGSGCEEGRAGVFPGADSGPLGRDLKKGH